MNRIKPDYAESFLSYDNLTALLQKKGLTGSPQSIKQKLKDVGYKRLSAYCFPFIDEHTQKINCDIDTLWGFYCLDRRLRFLILDAIERIEVGIRNRLVHYFTEKYGAYGYLDKSNFPNYAHERWKIWVERQRTQTEKSKKSRGTMAAVFFDKYSRESLPLWVLCELMDFGSTVVLFGLVEKDISSQVSRELGLPNHNILCSWLVALNDIRNAAAHHEKVWNRQWAKRPQLPRQNNFWHDQFELESNTWIAGTSNQSSFKDNWTGLLLTICNYLIARLASSSLWRERIFSLMNEADSYSNLFEHIGLHPHWRKHPLWMN